MQELVSRTFGERPVDLLRWRYETGPWRTDRIVLWDEYGEAVGFLGAVFGECWIDGRDATVSVHGDLLVDGHRGQGGGSMLLETALARDPCEARYAFPAGSAASLIGRFGTPLKGKLQQWVRWLSPSAIATSRGRLPRSGRSLVAVVLQAVSLLAGTHRRWEVTRITDPGEEVDDLAARSAAFARCILRRDAAYLRWRWLDQPGGRWTMLGVRDGDGRLRGITVEGMKEGEMHGPSPVGRIGDLLADGPTATRVLLDAATRTLESNGCGIVLLDLNDPRPWSRSACVRAGFLPRGRGPNVHLAGLPGSDAARDLDSWYLTLGDTDLA